MRKIIQKSILYTLLVCTIYSCQDDDDNITNPPDINSNEPIQTLIDLTIVEDDRVMVELHPPQLNTTETTYYLPSIIPGTYSLLNFGQFIDDFKAFDKLGKELKINKTSNNSWTISNADQLEKITYWVNDTFDTEKTHNVFSPAGSNILENQNYFLNLPNFIGYFSQMKETPYIIGIKHPQSFIETSSLHLTSNIPDFYESISSELIDVFQTENYFQVVDNPVVYTKGNSESFMINDLTVTLTVYSPHNTHTAKSLIPSLKAMMTAQKNFLGDFNTTKEYNVLVYLTTKQDDDAQGVGALEHNTSTTVVYPENSTFEALQNELINHFISHEFFHIITPLAIHSEEIHYFDYNFPNMSQHLWMYEGVTEYFSGFFRVNQNIFSLQKYIDTQIVNKMRYTNYYGFDTSLTSRSKNILNPQYQEQVYIFYSTATLVALCIDIQLREDSNGEEGLLDLMKKLAEKYGSEKPFKDDNLLSEITSLTSPNVGEILNQYIDGTTPHDYLKYLRKVGIDYQNTTIDSYYFFDSKYNSFNLRLNDQNEFFFTPKVPLNTGLINLGVQHNDILLQVNGEDFLTSNSYDILYNKSILWKTGDPVTLLIKRDGQEITLSGNIIDAKVQSDILSPLDLPTDDPRLILRNAWLKN
ncbi:hypothetical protein UJ101_02572 [Flavobacteriaceae bacterium UJ101]|nr:hypothetical protein UJ101_02572 [Flavobacteriaceae bacterium UJ101]